MSVTSLDPCFLSLPSLSRPATCIIIFIVLTFMGFSAIVMTVIVAASLHVFLAAVVAAAEWLYLGVRR